jgi:hypothetical protein
VAGRPFELRQCGTNTDARVRKWQRRFPRSKRKPVEQEDSAGSSRWEARAGIAETIEMTLENVTSAALALNRATLLRKNARIENWLGGRDSNPDTVVQSFAYRVDWSEVIRILAALRELFGSLLDGFLAFVGTKTAQNQHPGLVTILASLCFDE